MRASQNDSKLFQEQRAFFVSARMTDKSLMTGRKPHVFCFGLGTVASALALSLQNEGWAVSGTVRSVLSAKMLSEYGFRPFFFDGTASVPEECFADVTHILSSVPPDQQGDPVLRHHGPFLRRLCDLTSPWIGYLSTTGVYGDHGGRWVDEGTPPAPTSARTEARQTAEDVWRSLPQAAHVFRLAGIYGPAHNALTALRAGTARRIIKPGQVFCRVHIKDIVQVLRASMMDPTPGRTYNVCDDMPTPPQDIVEFAASLLGMVPPPEEDWETIFLSPLARSFYHDNRRVSNRRIKEELGIRLLYPTYREGLTACLQSLRSQETGR